MSWTWRHAFPASEHTASVKRLAAIVAPHWDHAHFKQYGDFSLDFEVVYHVLVPDFTAYMDIQQEINLRLFETFEKDGIAFAYPTDEIIMRPND